jgi:electron transport complex protein RnfA
MYYFLTDAIFAAVLGLLSQNLIFTTGIDSGIFIKLSRKPSVIWAFGIILLVCSTFGSLFASIADKYLLLPYRMSYLKPLMYIFIIVVFELLMQLMLIKILPKLGEKIGNTLQGAALNAAILGILLINNQNGNDIITSVLFGFFASIGFVLSIFIFSLVRERLDLSAVPEALRGMPISLIAAGLLSLAFMGFLGLSLPFIGY